MSTRLEAWRRGLDACMHAVMFSHEAIKLWLTPDGIPTPRAGPDNWEVGVYDSNATFKILQQDMADAVRDQRRRYG